MSEPVVWASNAMINPAMLRPISHNFDDGTDVGRAIYSKASSGNKKGQPLPADYFPSEIFVRPDAKTNYDTLPDLFFAGSYWIVSGKVADVLRRFDLGNANLYPTNVFRKDRTTPIGDRWFALNFGNVKLAYLRGGRNPTPGYPEPPIEHAAPTILKDNMLEVSAEALTGPDLWIDPQIRDTFFVSDGLAKALKDEGCARAFGFKKCRVV